METACDWQSEKSLTECLKHMLTSEIAYDVTFLLGEGRETVHSHKFILISRSPVFYAMFEGPMSEKGEVTVPDIEKEIFLDFLGYCISPTLRYLYTDQVSLNPQNALHVLYTAKKYCVDLLAKQCVEYFKNNLSVDNACSFLEQTHMCTEEQLAADCRKVINDNAYACLKSTSFMDLCQTCVYSITELDDLDVTEDVVYEAVMRWSEAECAREELEVTDANKRQVLGQVLYTIRFPIMDSEYFNKEVLKSDLLTPNEFLAVQRLQNNLILKSETKFKTAKRYGFQKIHRIERYSFLCSSWVHGGPPDAISFKVSKPVCFHGVGVYGCNSGSANYSVKLELLDTNGAIVSSTVQIITTDGSKQIFDVTLNDPEKLQADTVYTVVVTMKGSNVYQGQGGKTLISMHGNDITFFGSDRSANHTTVEQGQIPCLMCSWN